MNYYKYFGKQLIRSEELHQFYQNREWLPVDEMIVIIISSYMSLELQLESMKAFVKGIPEEEAALVKKMIALYEHMFQMIYKPKEFYSNQSFHYSVYCDRYTAYDTDEVTLENVFDVIEQEAICYNTMEEVLKHIGTYKKPCYCFTVELVLDSGSVPIYFHMLYVNGKYEIIRCHFGADIEKEPKWKHIVETYQDLFRRPVMPYEHGDCVQFQLPYMIRPLKGVLFREQDGNGCWYSFMYADGTDVYDKSFRGSEFVDMSYFKIALVTDYSVLDWLVLSKEC